MQNKEIWKEFPRNRNYSISNFGRVRTFHPRWKNSGRILTSTTARYPKFILHGSGKPVEQTFHRAVWETFVGRIPKGMHINHIDGNKRNPRLSNLECVSASGNLIHAYRTGLKKSATGSRWHASKLDEKKVSKIKKMLSKGISQYYLAGLHGVNPCTISDIARGITWRSVGRE